jgi:hypothetical protein
MDEHQLLYDAISDSEIQKDIIALQKKQLYDDGVKADGTPTGGYAPVTIEKWKPLALLNGMDGRSDHMTGKNSGETYDSMRVENDLDGFTIVADDRNNVFGQAFKYGSLIGGLGLTDESVSIIVPEVEQRIIEMYSELLAA